MVRLTLEMRGRAGIRDPAQFTSQLETQRLIGEANRRAQQDAGAAGAATHDRAQ